MNTRIIESGRAEFALKEVSRVISEEKAKAKEYKSYCRKFPAYIQTNGLAAAVAFAFEKKGAWLEVYKNAEKWLKEQGMMGEEKDLKRYVCSLDTVQYRIATNEILSLFNWIRRFASGLIEGD